MCKHHIIKEIGVKIFLAAVQLGVQLAFHNRPNISPIILLCVPAKYYSYNIIMRSSSANCDSGSDDGEPYILKTLIRTPTVISTSTIK